MLAIVIYLCLPVDLDKNFCIKKVIKMRHRRVFCFEPHAHLEVFFVPRCLCKRVYQEAGERKCALVDM